MSHCLKHPGFIGAYCPFCDRDSYQMGLNDALIKIAALRKALEEIRDEHIRETIITTVRDMRIIARKALEDTK